jgi:hypothetical protein
MDAVGKPKTIHKTDLETYCFLSITTAVILDLPQIIYNWSYNECVKVTIITTVSAWPEALIPQTHLLRKLSQDPLEIIAIIDTPSGISATNLWTPNLRHNAIKLAKELCDEVIEFPEHLHCNRREIFPDSLQIKSDSSVLRCADVIQFAWNEVVRKTTSNCLIIDSDMFPMKEFSIIKNLSNHQISGVMQWRTNEFHEVKYIWNGYIEVKSPLSKDLQLLNFDAGDVLGIPVDVGGNTHHWVKKETNLPLLRQVKHKQSLGWQLNGQDDELPSNFLDFVKVDVRNIDKKIYSEVYDGVFFHYREGGNWTRKPRRLVLRQRLLFVSSILNDDELNKYKQICAMIYAYRAISVKSLLNKAKWHLKKLLREQ